MSRDSENEPFKLEPDARVDGRRFAPAAARNKQAIADVLAEHLPASGAVLELASGSGEHAVHFAAAFPDLWWMPGDPDVSAQVSVTAWAAAAGLDNIAPAHAIDARDCNWPLDEMLATAPLGVQAAGLVAIVAINMVHIAPFAAARGLFAAAGAALGPGGMLFLYGPFSRNGVHIAPSNEAFDESLKGRDSEWGVRDLEQEIAPLGETSGFNLRAVIDMPANNYSVVFEKS